MYFIHTLFFIRIISKTRFYHVSIDISYNLMSTFSNSCIERDSRNTNIMIVNDNGFVYNSLLKNLNCKHRMKTKKGKNIIESKKNPTKPAKGLFLILFCDQESITEHCKQCKTGKTYNYKRRINVSNNNFKRRINVSNKICVEMGKALHQMTVEFYLIFLLSITFVHIQSQLLCMRPRTFLKKKINFL